MIIETGKIGLIITHNIRLNYVKPLHPKSVKKLEDVRVAIVSLRRRFKKDLPCSYLQPVSHCVAYVVYEFNKRRWNSLPDGEFYPIIEVEMENQT